MSEHGQQDALLVAPAPAQHRVTGDGVANPVARVLLDSGVPHLDRLFDYLVPPELDVAAAEGVRVVVRFGGQEVHGWVWQRAETTTHTGRLAPVRRVVSDLPVVPERTRRLVEAVAARTAGTRSDVLRLAVPTRHATTERAVRSTHTEHTEHTGHPHRPSRPEARPTGWGAYTGGAELLDAISDGHAPRTVLTALPGREGVLEDWESLLAQAVQASLSGGRGALIAVATTAQAELLAERLSAALDGEEVLVLSAEHGPARRYRVFTRLLLGHARVVVGTRAVVFAPVMDLGLAVIWDDGDDRLDEPRAPYVHARTVLALRSGLEHCALLIASRTRSVEAQSYVLQGWARDLEAPRPLIRATVPRIEVPGDSELDREGAGGRARIPSLAHRALRQALDRGPVLVQVARSGYAPVVVCATCRAVARCRACSGPLSMGRSGEASCRWCGRSGAGWACPHCGGEQLRMAGSGSVRTGDELGRAFPGVPVVVSGTRADHGVVATVDRRPRLVVATPGAEPVAEGGYTAVLLLDGAVLSARPELGASSEALRRWANAATLARQDARVILLGSPDLAVSQALVRWNHAGFAADELRERLELELPPAVRCARLDGPLPAVEAYLAAAKARGWDVLGPVRAPEPAAQPTRAGAPAPERVRALVRVPLAQGRELAEALRLQARERSVHREDPVRIELDPTVLW
ncbi:primosomal protein N' [Actinomyces respiraculi]|uniref:primosomal protein N' family DNA-binding protein n=1 Tax=Actinomyces respiraculi TaxID=2744574 RepID=UPI00142400FC|nr:primosomal protein N' [Actinomyces respiraculi]